MNITDTGGEFISLNDSLAPDNLTHNLTFNTPGQSSFTLSQNYTMSWIFVSIYFGTTTQIILNTLNVNSFTLTTATHLSPMLTLNFNISSYRELRLYNYALTITELNISSGVQANPYKDAMQFYYMFLCNQSQNYFYDSVNPSINTAQVATYTTWISKPSNSYVICPQGYTNTVTFGNDITNYQQSTCISNA